jgi:hypothetical protein
MTTQASLALQRDGLRHPAHEQPCGRGHVLSVLRAPRARVLWQLAAGISVWDDDDGIVQVVVPGNVGGPSGRVYR